MNKEMIENIVVSLLASLPQLVIILTSLVTASKALKKETSKFPDIAGETKTTLKDSFNEASKTITSKFNETTEKLVNITKETTKAIEEKVNGSLEGMKNELNTYKTELNIAREQTSISVKQGKIFMDIISELVAKDPQMIKDKVSQFISTKANLVREELEKYPELLVADMKLLESSLEEFKEVAGKQNLDELMERLGYERKKQE